jgi:aminocarboxymuconate-semialdehyde decarboxylase
MIFGRLKRSFATAPAQNADPAIGFHKLYFDSVVYDGPTVRFICDVAGADRVLMGTDEPFAIAEQQPVKLIDSCDLAAKDRQAILGGTAAKLFGIS